ncbi:Slp family lipoprotein [Alteromonas gilva]|uniref:Slp family lipoprotein n=1 Tax=Alteromonas gilva TaxID=2987522 RepID=A0ABT5L0M5_9ALTE|nr:Slp family lipoprotein [Alteromonas gilva]MDC8830585.1 Slp family lipoprotein [Alteromonas gilva]
MILRTIVVLFALSLSACAIVPEPIKVADESQLTGYNKAVVADDTIVGTPARWGGIITKVENKPNKTLIEVVHFPLNHYGKPNTSEDTVGRFKAVINKFVDPIMFEEGRTITFVGTVGKPLAGMVGEQPYMFPALNTENYYMWRQQRMYDTSGVFFNFYSGWYSPFYHPFWRPWGFHYPRAVILRSNDNPRFNGGRFNAIAPSNGQIMGPLRRDNVSQSSSRAFRGNQPSAGVNRRQVEQH